MKKKIYYASEFRGGVKSVTPYRTIEVFEWLKSDEFRSEVERIRNTGSKEERDKLKKLLPTITVSGTFKKRNAAGLDEPTGLIIIDIDGKDNPHHTDMEELKRVVFKLPFVIGVMLSCSGSGVLAIVELDDYRNQYQHSLALAEDFASIGVNIDPSCKDLPRLRFATYDHSPLYRSDAEVYVKLISSATSKQSKTRTIGFREGSSSTAGRPNKRWKEKRPQTIDDFVSLAIGPLPKWPATTNPNYSTQQQLIYTILAPIANTDFDVTELYNDWLRIAALLALHFGDEEGRGLFHDVCRNYPGYDSDECDLLYSVFVLIPNKNYSINQLKEMAKHYGF